MKLHLWMYVNKREFGHKCLTWVRQNYYSYWFLNLGTIEYFLCKNKIDRKYELDKSKLVVGVEPSKWQFLATSVSGKNIIDRKYKLNKPLSPMWNFLLREKSFRRSTVQEQYFESILQEGHLGTILSKSFS